MSGAKELIEAVADGQDVAEVVSEGTVNEAVPSVKKYRYTLEVEVRHVDDNFNELPWPKKWDERGLKRLIQQQLDEIVGPTLEYVPDGITDPALTGLSVDPGKSSLK